MTTPKVTYTVLNGRLGVKKPGGVELHAYVGPASSGDTNKPTRHARSKDLLDRYTSGPGPELAIRAIENYGAEVVYVRTEDANPSSFGDLDDSLFTGGCVVQRDGGSAADDDYEVLVQFVNGGTVGTDTDITYQWSLDGGRTMSPVTLLSGTSIILPNSGGIQYNFTSAPIDDGASFTDLSIAPKWDTSALSAALDVLKTTRHEWQAVWIAGPMDAEEAAVVQLFLAAIEAQSGRCRHAYVQLRMPDPGEDDATYQDAVSADYSEFVEKKITACAAAARVLSARTGRPFVFRRSPLYAISGLPQSLPLGVDMSQTIDATPGGLLGTSITDDDGNNVEHDEMLNPGLDDARFLALRSWPDKEGVYVNNPSTLEGTGLDFHLDQFVRILCRFCDTARGVLVDELSRELDLNLKDNGPNKAGAPTERECQRIDSRVLSALNNALKGQVTGVEFALHRDDDVLGSQTLNADGGIIFHGYPKLIQFTVAAINPAAG